VRIDASINVFLVVGIFTLVGCGSPQTRPPTVTSEAMQKEVMLQKQLVIRSQIDAQNRLARVGHQVLVAGAELCNDEVRPTFGFLLLSESAFEEELLEAVRTEGFDKSVRVSYVIPGSKAELVGVQIGDQLKRIGDWEVPVSDTDPLRAALKKLQSQGPSVETINLLVSRGGSDIAISIDSEVTCDYSVLLGKNDDLNAYAGGSSIIVEKGMMRFAGDDDELALIISHELAHNAMGHVESRTANALLGGAPDFWRRMAIEHPESIELRKSHPTTPERFVALNATITEIELKVSAGRPLLPGSLL